MKTQKVILAIDLMLSLSPYKEMAYIKLIKLFYLIDRAFLELKGISFTGDSYVSMKFGPVVSGIYSSITELKENPKLEGSDSKDYWENYFKISHSANPQIYSEFKKKYFITSVPKEDRNQELLINDTLEDEEEKIIKEAVEYFKDYGWRAMVDFTHYSCNEWRDPIPYRVIDLKESEILESIQKGNKLYPFGNYDVTISDEDYRAALDRVSKSKDALDWLTSKEGLEKIETYLGQ